MSNNPGDTPENGPDDGQNPFKGTPFEQFFAGGMPGLPGMGAMPGMPGGMPDLNQLMGQLQSLLTPYDGPLNWQLATDLARQSAAQEPDPSPTQKQKDAVADAVRLADHWLDETTSFPSGVTTTAAWSRAEWIVETMDVWKVLVEPVALQSVQAMGTALPDEAKAQSGPILGLLGKAVGAILATQVGSGLGALAGEVLSVSDIGLPLAPAGRAALLPANVAAFAEGLDVGEDDVLLYLALREAAHQRLFAGAPWLRDYLIGTVTAFAQGIEINVEGIQQRMEEQMRGVDPSNPESMQQLLDSGLFELPESPAQKAALARLEVALALVEGWVDEIVGQATAARMPAAAKLQEAVRRRRAAGGPAEQTFATLVGLELRPRRLREASTLWGSLRTRQGVEARDGVWMHPDLLPTAADLDDPLGFREEASAPEALSEADFDAELARLLDGDGPDSDGAADWARGLRSPGVTLHADALSTLAGWAAPDADQERLRASYVEHLRAHPDGVHRSCFPAHLTAGALVVDASLTHVLLNLHGKARRWFAFGGHCEAADDTLAAVARREALEESGLADLTFDPVPAHLDQHAVGFCAPRGLVQHLDVRYVARSPDAARPERSEESLDVRWWPLTALPELEPEMLDLIAIARARFS